MCRELVSSHSKIQICAHGYHSNNNIVVNLGDKSLVAASELDHGPARLSLHVQVHHTEYVPVYELVEMTLFEFTKATFLQHQQKTNHCC